MLNNGSPCWLKDFITIMLQQSNAPFSHFLKLSLISEKNVGKTLIKVTQLTYLNLNVILYLNLNVILYLYKAFFCL